MPDERVGSDSDRTGGTPQDEVRPVATKGGGVGVNRAWMPADERSPPLPLDALVAELSSRHEATGRESRLPLADAANLGGPDSDLRTNAADSGIASEQEDRLRLEREKAQLQAEVNRLQERKTGGAGSKLLQERLDETRRELRETEQRRESAAKKSAELEEEVLMLRSVLEQSVEQMQGETDTSGEEIEALREELERVRVQAAIDLEALRKDLRETRAKQAGDGKRDVDDATQLQALRQEVDGLHRSIAEKERSLAQSENQCRRLEDALEDRDQELDRVRQQHGSIESRLEIASSQLADAEQARMLAEGEVDRLSERELATVGVDVDDEWHPDDASRARLPLRPLIAGIVIGALLVFGAVEALMVWSGSGEMVATLLDGAAVLPKTERLTPAAGKDDASSRVSAALSKTSAAPDAVVGSASVPEQSPPKVAVRTDRRPVRIVRDALRAGVPGPAMVRLEGGIFTMGSRRPTARTDERPPHKVRIKPFYIDRYEVTFQEYDRFARATGRRLPDDLGWGRGRRPVMNVSWADAQAYARWLSAQTGKTYRLPSEAEWELAARGGSANAYWWGYRPQTGKEVCFDCGTRWDNRSTAPVGSFAANPYGLYDMAGNVLEWVGDCYHADYQGAPADGSLWNDPNCGRRVARGGAFNKPLSSLRSASRHSYVPGSRLNMLGFRVARDE